MMIRFIFICFIGLVTTVLFAQPAPKDPPPDFVPANGEPGLMPDAELNSKLARLSTMYKLDSAMLAACDKIITYDREVYVGKIHNITFSEVRFTCPPNDALLAVNKSRISQILYADGRRDVFIALEDRTVKQQALVDTARIIIKNQKDWMKVMVTEDPSEVNHLTALGNLSVDFEADMGNAGNDELMRGANILLKKKAALLKAHCVLVETKFFRKSYGDLPRVEVTARAFGY